MHACSRAFSPFCHDARPFGEFSGALLLRVASSVLVASGAPSAGARRAAPGRSGSREGGSRGRAGGRRPEEDVVFLGGGGARSARGSRARAALSRTTSLEMQASSLETCCCSRASSRPMRSRPWGSLARCWGPPGSKGAGACRTTSSCSSSSLPSRPGCLCSSIRSKIFASFCSCSSCFWRKNSLKSLSCSATSCRTSPTKASGGGPA
mmetsp:Transcript_29996/g.85966  ORF Transcript_29996/g.85966 Transcript_29996/m.85966 type:complete len:208 (+) Transcript_29996:87-710(+)